MTAKIVREVLIYPLSIVYFDLPDRIYAAWRNYHTKQPQLFWLFVRGLLFGYHSKAETVCSEIKADSQNFHYKYPTFDGNRPNVQFETICRLQ